MYKSTVTNQIIEDNAPFTDSEGIKYPRDFPKDEIAELIAVTETDRPEDTDDEFVTGFTVDGDGLQIWETEARDESYAKDKWQGEMDYTDVDMPRPLEDVIDAMPEDMRSSIAPETLALYDAKKVKRQEGVDAGFIPEN